MSTCEWGLAGQDRPVWKGASVCSAIWARSSAQPTPWEVKACSVTGGCSVSSSEWMPELVLSSEPEAKAVHLQQALPMIEPQTGLADAQGRQFESNKPKNDGGECGHVDLPRINSPNFATECGLPALHLAAHHTCV